MYPNIPNHHMTHPSHMASHLGSYYTWPNNKRHIWKTLCSFSKHDLLVLKGEIRFSRC
jgi:hypothetical protein